MDELLRLERQQFKGRYYVKSLASGITQLEKEIEYFKACLAYRKEHNLPTHLQQLVFQSKAIQLPSLTVLEHLLKDATELLPVLHRLNTSGIASGRFSYHDLQPPAYKANPTNTVKQGGHYNPKGYPTYLALYMHHNQKWHKYIPQSDADGFYFMADQKKVYYYKFKADYGDFHNDSTPSTSTESPPEKGKKKKKKKAKKAKGPEKGRKTLVPRTVKGGRLGRLLAEARDPPAIEISGAIEVIKGHRRRIKKAGGYKDITGVFHWSKGNPCFIVLFNCEQERTEFLERKTKSQLSLRLCNFM